MDDIESRVKTEALNHGHNAEELYVHIPSRGVGKAHIELEEDFSNVSPEMNRALMEYVDVSDEQVATKHKLLDVLDE